MAVTIENMTMPKSCEDCPFSSCKGRLNGFYCDITTFDVDMESKERDADCPLKEVDNNSVLENIKAEIVDMRSKKNCSCSDCLDIIDKHIAEG